MMRVGIGYDSHRFADPSAAEIENGIATSDAVVILGGVKIPHPRPLTGHSDADAIAHAVTDAILGACAAGDIGEMFSDKDPANKGRDSIEMLRAAVQRIESRGFRVQNVDVTVVAESPKIGPHRTAIAATLARALHIYPDTVSVKGKTNEGMGWIGRGEGIACMAVATVNELRP